MSTKFKHTSQSVALLVMIKKIFRFFFLVYKSQEFTSSLFWTLEDEIDINLLI